MSDIILEKIIENISFDSLPYEFNSLDYKTFSNTINLWDYQQDAVKTAIKFIWKYFVDFESDKNRLFDAYKDYKISTNLDFDLNKASSDINNIMKEYYNYSDDKINYSNFINRLNFWMATGSGKSYIIIKLFSVLYELIKNKIIPQKDILLLTYREDLIIQFQKHINEYNIFKDIKIIFENLKNYDEIKREKPLLKNDEIIVFYYRSDNLIDEQKDKIIDFKNYENNGNWYLFLDEAHKGDKTDSKSQNIFNVLSRNGLLFNFSATFTDIKDIISTVYNFNLERFINKGYGKHLIVLKQEFKSFEQKEDYNDVEKQKIVLKSLILLTYVKKYYEKIHKTDNNLYHNPLLMALVNSVNTKDADLKLFFNELVQIAQLKIKDTVFQKSLDELVEELKNEPEFLFENKKININFTELESITKTDIIKYIFNSETSGEIEVLIRSANRQEIAFKLKTSDRPFALIRIGDISNWLKEDLKNYDIQKGYKDDSYFQKLNTETSDINILMGSRSFYEGWDSNRPNIINYINIGKGTDAQKFILQSVGRGIRIEPIKNKRQRLLTLINSNETEQADKDRLEKIKDYSEPLETLFVFATNRIALNTVIEQLDKEKVVKPDTDLPLFDNINENEIYLIPVYDELDKVINIKEKNFNIKEFEISENDFNMLKNFLQSIDDRILFFKYDTTPKKIKFLRNIIKHKDKHFKIDNEYSSIENIDIIVKRLLEYFNLRYKVFKEFQIMKDEINHHKKIKVNITNYDEFKEKIETKKNAEEQRNKLIQDLKDGKIEVDKFNKKLKNLENAEAIEINGTKIEIKNIVQHYYTPLFISNDEKIDFINHIINVRSEVKFIKNLEDYISKDNNKFDEYDWWKFSKIDQTTDTELYIPYYNPKQNQISKFHPDFIFWLKKGNDYQIIFIDPKGVSHTDYQFKIKGYKEIFEKNNKPKKFKYENYNVTVKLIFAVANVSNVPKPFDKYAINNTINGIDTKLQIV